MARCPVCGDDSKWRIVHSECRITARRQSADFFRLGIGALPEPTFPKGKGTIRDVKIEGALEALRQWSQSGTPLKEGQALRDRLLATDGMQKALGWRGALKSLDRALQLAEIRENVAAPVRPSGFNFTASERVLHVANGPVKYLEDKMMRHYKGKSRGVGVRVLPGVYVRAGRSTGRAIDSQQTVVVSRMGSAAFTTEHFYYKSPQATFRVRWDHMVTVDYYKNGFGFQRDGAKALPQSFVLDAPWFYHALIEEIRNPGVRVRLAVPEFGKEPKTHAVKTTSRDDEDFSL